MDLISSLRQTSFYDRHQWGIGLTFAWSLVIIPCILFANGVWNVYYALVAHKAEGVDPSVYLLIAIATAIVAVLLFTLIIVPLYLSPSGREND